MSGGMRQRSQLPPRKPTQTESARSLKPLNQAKMQPVSLNPHAVVKSLASSRASDMAGSRKSFDRNQQVISKIQQEKQQIQA
jgi:hypothetical protein